MEETLQMFTKALAGAIREVEGSSDPIDPQDFAARILALSKDDSIQGELKIVYGETEPASVLGGTWVEDNFPYGTFLMAAGHGGKAGESGGENQKTLSLDQTPNHYHDVYFSGGTYSGYKLTAGGGATTEGVLGLTDFAANKIGHTDVLTTHSAGGGQPFDNRPLYRSVHIWQKVS